MRYLIDTDWTVNYLRGARAYVDTVAAMSADGIGLSIISLAELLEGTIHSRDPAGSERGLQSFLSFVELVALDVEICRIFGSERGRLRNEGFLMGDLDILIGATAVRHGLTLLTNNRRHFDRIQGIAIVAT